MQLITKENFVKLPIFSDLGEFVKSDLRIPLMRFDGFYKKRWFILMVDRGEKNDQNHTVLYGLYYKAMPDPNEKPLKTLQAVLLPFGFTVQRGLEWDVNQDVKDAKDYLNQYGYDGIDWLLIE